MTKLRWTVVLSAILLSTLLFVAPTFGVWGVLDEVPGATIVLPFFEVGIDPVAEPQDTRPVIYNRGTAPLVVHWEVYNIDGLAIFSGDETIQDAGSWAFSMRDLINTEAPGISGLALVDGDFFRGFMTIDAVTEPTNLSPFDDGYPFRTNNWLLGYAYYTRLAEGSANGLTLPALENTANGAVDPSLWGFYGTGDRREEMDANARTCARDLVAMAVEVCPASDPTVTIRSRVFQSNAINGQTRIIVFAWDTSRPGQGGPSAICDGLGSCPTSYTFQRFRENAQVADSGTLQLNHVVNVIDTANGDVAPGEMVIRNVEDPGDSLQLYAFSFNSAQPAGNPNVNWDAIFQSSIVP